MTESGLLSGEVSAESQSACEVAPISDRLWRARIFISSAALSERTLVARMREAKQKIAAQFHAPLELLEFREILGKEKTAAGLSVHLTIGRLDVGQGRTILHLLPLRTPTGEEFEDMIAQVDFYYLDEFDQVITRERLLGSLDKLGLARKMLDRETLECALDQVIANRSGVTLLEVARGRLPDRGRDAELEYTFFPSPEAARGLAEYHTSRKVKAGDILCQRVPPQDGRQPGVTVLNQSVPPLKGWDFQLTVGTGARLSRDGHRITAARDGLAVMRRANRKVYTPGGTRVIPAHIEVGVNELVAVKGDQLLNFAVPSSVEIEGDLKAGSSITADGEVLLCGDVEEGAQISAGSDVLIQGQVSGARIVSETCVIGGERVLNSTILAEERIELRALAENSDLTADTINVLEALGCRLRALRQIQVDRAGNAPSGRRTTIRLERHHFYADKLDTEMQEVDALSTSLVKLQEFFGAETVDQISADTLQHILLAQLKRLRQAGHKKLRPDQVQAVKLLIEVVNPLRGAIAEKSDEIKILLQKISEVDAEKPLVLIRERICDPVEVTIDDATKTLAPTESGIIITTTESGDITTEPLSSSPGCAAPQRRRNEPK